MQRTCPSGPPVQAQPLLLTCHAVFVRSAGAVCDDSLLFSNATIVKYYACDPEVCSERGVWE